MQVYLQLFGTDEELISNILLCILDFTALHNFYVASNEAKQINSWRAFALFVVCRSFFLLFRFFAWIHASSKTLGHWTVYIHLVPHNSLHHYLITINLHLIVRKHYTEFVAKYKKISLKWQWKSHPTFLLFLWWKSFGVIAAHG